MTDSLHPGYKEPHPWEPPPAKLKFILNSLRKSKAKCSRDDLQQLRESLDVLTDNEDVITKFTDDSVDPLSGKAGAAFLCNDLRYAQRLSSDTTIFQAELFAIRAALKHALVCSETQAYILSGSLFTLHTLREADNLDNIRLDTSTLFRLQQLARQGKSVSFMWIPSHTGIEQNEQVDTAAKDSLHYQHIIHIKPSINHIKTLGKKTAHQISKIQHHVWVQAGSPSANWYKIVTDYDPITIPRSMPRTGLSL